MEEGAFFAAIPQLRRACGDRAVLRALHFFGETRRAQSQAEALERGDFPGFLELVKESGRSSWLYLQNVTVPGAADQSLALTLAVCQDALEGRGACRVHGGGFAGTVQAFVPLEILDAFRARMESVLGEGRCHVLHIRPQGGAEWREGL